jgi:hypothetical protein
VILFINGAFGIGKSTVARHLRARLAGSAIFDPEPLGVVLQQLARWLPLDGAGTDDFQDLRAWRAWFVRGIGAVRRVRGTVIVPMAFSNVDYLRELLDGARIVDPQVLHVCLIAPIETVHQRLTRRAASERTVVSAWAMRRAAECCEAHRSDRFAQHVAASNDSPASVADEISALARRRMRTRGAPLASTTSVREP